MGSIAWIIWQIASVFFEIGIAFYYLYKQLGVSLQKRKLVLFCYFCFALFIIVWHTLELDAMILMPLSSIVFTVFAFLLFEETYSQKILASCICNGVMSIGNVLTSIIVSSINKNLSYAFEPSWFRLLGTIFYIVFIFGILFYLSRRKKNKLELPLFLRILLCALMGLQTVTAALILHTGFEGVWGSQAYPFIIGCIAILFSTFSMIVIIDIIGRVMYKNHEAEMEAYLSRLAIQHTGDMIASGRAIEAFKHDFKNHILTIKGFLAEKEYTNLDKYISELSEDFNGASFSHCDTGNKVIDYILSSKIVHAGSFGIKITHTIDRLDKLPVSETNLCSLLGNLFDNGIEACKRATTENPYINIDMKYVQGIFKIQMTNSSPNDYRFDKDNKLMSTKAKNRRGLGLEQIERVAHECNGWCKYVIGPDSFTIKIFLPLRSEHI